MAGIGLKEAAKLTGKNQSTIHRAMKNNKLAFTLDDSGQRLIDPSELDRWLSDNPGRIDGSKALHDDTAQRIEVVQLRAQLDAEKAKGAILLERMAEQKALLDDLREERDNWRTQAQTLLLTDQRPVPEPERRHWWQRRKAVR